MIFKNVFIYYLTHNHHKPFQAGGFLHMKKFSFIVGMLLISMLCAAPVWSADARHVAFLKAAQNFVDHKKFPDNEVIDNESINDVFGLNKIAIADVNGDGKQELIIQFTTSSVSEMREYVCGFNEKTNKLTVNYIGSPDMEYFDNGCIKEHAMRNKGWDSVYDFLMFNDKTQEYENAKGVIVWNKKKSPLDPNEEKPFPDKIDVTGDGFVYFISDDTFDGAKDSDEPVDTPIYKAWVKKYIGGAKQVEIEWFPANTLGIKMLKAKLEGSPIAYPSFSADAIYDKLLKAAQNYVIKHILPDEDESSNDDIPDLSKITLAICDVDGDGKPNLLIRNTADNSEYVYRFNENIEKITLDFGSGSQCEYFNNGCIKSINSDENAKLGGEKYPPYQFATYNKKNNSFDLKGNVVIWSKEASPTNPQDDNKPFPVDIDKTGDGFVYFIYDDDFEDEWWDEKAVDTPVYEAWIKKYIGDAKPIHVHWVPATADGIKILEAKRHE